MYRAHCDDHIEHWRDNAVSQNNQDVGVSFITPLFGL